MPRGTGVGNADSIQQRARFFGYKRGYLGYCRIFLENDVQSAFKNYVKHEENIRQQLIENRGKPLLEWKRKFFLDKSLKPTRSAVLDVSYQRERFNNKWYIPKYIHQNTEDLIENNNGTVNDFWSTLVSQTLDQKSFRLNNKEILIDNHLFAIDVPLEDVLKKLFVNYKIKSSLESLRFTGLILLIQEYLSQHPEELCDVYLINKGKPRQRSINNIKTRLSQPFLFQGKTDQGKLKSNSIKYPGDGKLKEINKLTVQIHNINLSIKNQISTPKGFDDLRILTVWVPEKMSVDLVYQDQC